MNFGRKLTTALGASLTCVMLCTGVAQAAKTNVNAEIANAKTGYMTKAKYVFMFIGDGMASVQIHAAETYLANKATRDDVSGSTKASLLSFSTMPVQGLMSTFADSVLITDSAPAATAMATGMKTGDGVISMDPSKTKKYTTVAEIAKAAGMKVGIVSSVSLDHATPACFYAHQASRNSYDAISTQAAKSGFDYFAGGGFLGTGSNPVGAAQAAGYTVADSRDEFDALSAASGKVLAINPTLDGSKAIYYDIDRNYANDATKHISLAEFTAKGIELLNNPKGFFMMVEGGKIDWACHANDARTSIDDTIAFDEAVKVAISFMAAHPSETLIVVTGDHETGGLSLGWAGTKYASYHEKLEAQQLSFQEFDKIISAVKAAGAPATIDAVYDATSGRSLAQDMKEFMGLDYASLTAFEKVRLDNAYQRAMFGTLSGTGTTEEDYLLYGGYNALSVTITHIVNNRAGIGWTSYSHTAVPVPVLADGACAEMFDGFYDNTDLAHKIAAAMRLVLPNE